MNTASGNASASNGTTTPTGLLPLVIQSQERRRYLEVIAFADAGDLQPLSAFLSEAIDGSLRLGLQAASRLIDLHTNGEKPHD